MEKETKKIKPAKIAKTKNYKTEEQQEMIKFIVVLLIVAICVVGVYIFTRAFVTKDLFNENEEETVTGSINYDVAVVGTMLNRPYDEYYVISYDSTASDAATNDALLSNYKNTATALKIYYVDLNNELNKSYYSEESNKDAKTISELKLGDLTLIKIKNGQINKYIEGYENIQKQLGLSN